MPALVFTLYGLGLFPVIVGMLSDPLLVSSALPLVGNLALCQSDQMDALIRCGIFDILLKIEGHAADVFWVLSNLLESVPDRTLHFFDDSLVVWAVNLAGGFADDVRTEAVFFIATLVVSRDTEDLAVFMGPGVIELLVRMLKSPMLLIVFRCLNALARLARAGAGEAVWKGRELREAVERLARNGHTLIEEWAVGLLQEIEGGNDGEAL
jgi:hypothetical protein